MTKDSSMIVRDDQNQISGIRIAGVNFSTKEAFVEYRENHQFKTGDAVQALVKNYSDAYIAPACVCGINDFGDNRVAIDIAYLDKYDMLKFDHVASDEIMGDAKKSEGVVGLAPINEFNDVGLRFSSVMQGLTGQITAKEVELEKLRNQLAMLEKFFAKQGE